MRIAMWSGPRNLSTAMMYAFASRADFAVVDEPFYAAYLALTGLDHPMRDAVMNSQPTDPDQVEKALLGPVPDGRAHYYQKQMTQHMVSGVPRGWMDQMRHVFLIRHPARVIASFAAKYESPTQEDIGFAQQAALFDAVRDPIVIDSYDIRQNPEAMLRKLCAALGLDWDPAMLSWPSGGNRADGVWAAHWYGAVHRSTGFAGPEGPLPELAGEQARLQDQAMPYYARLKALSLSAADPAPPAVSGAARSTG